MSWQATVWAANLPHSRVGHVPFRVLMIYADHAKPDGSAVWVTNTVLADTLEVSERTIARAVAELKTQQLVRLGDQRLVSHLPKHRRPMVYDLVMATPESQPTTLPDPVDNQLSTGVTNLSGVTTGVLVRGRTTPVNTQVLNATTEGLSPHRVERCRSHRDGLHRHQAPSGRCDCGLRDDGQFIDPMTGRAAS